MERYVLGGKIDGLVEVQSMKDISNMDYDDRLFVLLDRDTDNQLTKIYSAVKKACQQNIRVFVLKIKGESSIALPISALVVSYGGTDIYTLEDSAMLNFNYIKTIEDRKPSMKEIDWYVDAQISAYDDVARIMSALRDATTADDTHQIANIIKTYGNRINQFIGVIEYMRVMTDKALDNINEADNIQRDLDSLRESYLKLEEIKQNLEKEKLQLMEKIGSMENKASTGEPILTEYTELSLKTVQNVGVRRVLYFKEISPCRYINSLIYSLMYYLNRMKKFKVKLMIYDNKTDSLGRYAPIEVVDSKEFLNNKDRLVGDVQEMVVIEPNASIITSVLKSDVDILIIYDRLGKKKDIVTDVAIAKYYVINSRKEYDAVCKEFQQEMTIDKVISNEGVFAEAIAVREVEDYKGLNESSKLSKYYTMQNPSNVRSGKVIDLICEHAYIDQLKKQM